MSSSIEFEKALKKIQFRIAQFMKIHANPHDTSQHNEKADQLKKINQILKTVRIGALKEQDLVKNQEVSSQFNITEAPTALSAIIQGGESGTVGYNAYNRGTLNGRILGALEHRELVNMTIGEIKADQQRGHDDPQRLFAVGKYQMIPTTLAEGTAALNISDDTKYSASIQELLFSDYLLGRKRPAIRAYIQGSGSAYNAQVAGAQEWASIACPPGHKKAGNSYYGDGNHASITAEAFLTALDEAKETYRNNIESGMAADEAYRKAVTSLQGNIESNTSSSELAYETEDNTTPPDTPNSELAYETENNTTPSDSPYSLGTSSDNNEIQINEQTEITEGGQIKPPWIREAEKHLGKTETARIVKDDPWIRLLFEELGTQAYSWAQNRTVVEANWCAAFVSYCLKKTGQSPLTEFDGMRALAYANKYGTEITRPVYGALAIVTRDGGGHIGFVVGYNKETGVISMLGGNQGKSVTIKEESRSLVAYKIPSSWVVPEQNYLDTENSTDFL